MPPTDELDPEQIMKKFMEKYGSGKKGSKFFARMSAACQKQEEAIIALTPLAIPPRPQTLIETPISQTLSAHRETPQILPETLTQRTEPTVQNPQFETLPLTQETNPSDPILQTETETPTIEEEEPEETGDKIDTEESEEEENGGEQVENEEGEELGGGDVTRSRVQRVMRRVRHGKAKNLNRKLRG